MRARDTTAAAAELQHAVLRKMSMEQRMLIAASMSNDARSSSPSSACSMATTPI